MATRWRHSVGPRGATVVVAERTRGGNVRIGARDAKISGTRWLSLRFRVRDAHGELIPEAVERAKAEAAKLSNRLIQGHGMPAREPTLRDLLARFERDVIPGMSGKHHAETKRHVELLRRTLGPKKAIDICGTDWAWLQRSIMSGALEAHGRTVPEGKRKSVGPRSAAKVLKTLRHVCRHALTVRRDGRPLIPFDPTQGLDLPTTKDPQRPVCDDATLEKLQKAARSHRVRTGGGYVPSPMPVLLTLAADTGRRIGAIVALRWDDWNPEAGTFGTLIWRADSDKLGRTTATPVTPSVRDALEAHRQETGGATGWIFPAPGGEGHVTVSCVSHWFRKVEKAAKIPHRRGFGWHTLRRAFATKRKGMSVQDVAALGGWKGTQVLQTLYQQADVDAMERVLLEGQKVGLRAVR